MSNETRSRDYHRNYMASYRAKHPEYYAAELTQQRKYHAKKKRALKKQLSNAR